ncbi:MAG: 50S ribosomal protein L11 methyltransferase [Magnetococcales bacterium]|nr:50S ribosomal protein L11 methyltransferase [Magnetococcales bacterium]
MIWELRLKLERTYEEIVEDFLSGEGSMGVSMAVDGTSAIVTGFFAEDVDRSGLEIRFRLILAAAGVELESGDLTWKLLPDCDWGEAWKAYYQPVPVGRRLLILPSWQDPPLGHGRLVIRMDPEMAFGSGTHATTQGCLELLEETAETRPLGQVLDMGSGSGILSIGAVLLGAEGVMATDLDPIAVETTGRNCQLNGMGDRVKVVEASEVPPGPFQTIVANILARILMESACALVSALAGSGRLILSGILKEQAREVQMAFEGEGVKLVEMRLMGEEWVVLVLDKEMS